MNCMDLFCKVSASFSKAKAVFSFFKSKRHQDQIQAGTSTRLGQTTVTILDGLGFVSFSDQRLSVAEQRM